MGRQLPEALPMNRMAAGHFVRSATGTEKEFLTNRAVGLILSTFAVVVQVQALINTHATIVTVSKILAPTDATKATVLTMVWLFIVCHPQVTNIAMIFPKLDSATDAIVPDRKPTNREFIEKLK
jgi:hypothetical protein